MWQRCAQKRAALPIPARAAGRRTPPATPRLPVRVRRHCIPVPLYHHARVRGIWNGRSVLFGRYPVQAAGTPAQVHPQGMAVKADAPPDAVCEQPVKLGSQPVRGQRRCHVDSLCTTTPYFRKYSAWIRSATVVHRRAGTGPTSRRFFTQKNAPSGSRSVRACPAIIPSDHGSDVPPLVVARRTRRS